MSSNEYRIIAKGDVILPKIITKTLKVILQAPCKLIKKEKLEYKNLEIIFQYYGFENDDFEETNDLNFMLEKLADYEIGDIFLPEVESLHTIYPIY